MWCVTLCLSPGKDGGTGHGLPCAQWSHDGHSGAAALRLPPGSAFGHVRPQLTVPKATSRNRIGHVGLPSLRLFLHHNSSQSLPHRALLLHDVCGWENLQTGEWSIQSVCRNMYMTLQTVSQWDIMILCHKEKLFLLTKAFSYHYCIKSIS